MSEPLRVLVVEDRVDDVTLVLRELRRAGFEPEHRRVETERELRAALADEWDVVISDFSMPALDAPSALRVVRECGFDLPFVIVTGSVGEEAAVEVMRAGADDYVLKDRLTRLGEAVRRAVDAQRARARSRQAEAQLRQKELELLQAQRMEAIGRLAGGVAHDFNNLLTVMFSCVGALRRSSDLGTDDRDLVQQIDEASQRAAALTRQLLSLSRRQAPRLERLDVNRVISEIAQLLRRIIGSDVVLTLDLEPELGAVHGSRSQLEQVILNLAVNARDAMPRGGRLAIATSHENPADSPSSRIRLAVRDDGVGMDEETRQRIFQPFFTTKPEGQGTGLGLSTLHEIVTASGGEVRVESAPGRGALFEIYLPCVEDENEAIRPIEPVRRAPDPTRATVLVVDDDETVRRLVGRALVDAGHRVFEATDAAHALAIAAADPGGIDLLVSDVVMPGMSGVTLAERLRVRRPQLPVLFISGDLDPDRPDRGTFPAGSRLLAKPFTLPGLLDAVRESLAGSVPSRA